MDCKRELGCGCGLPDPDLVVMECRAAHRSNGFGPCQHVDAAAADMGLVRMDGFGDQDAAAYTVEQFCGQRGFAPDVLPSVTASPSAMERLEASSGCIITVGVPSRACDPGVSLKLVLR